MSTYDRFTTANYHGTRTTSDYRIPAEPHMCACGTVEYSTSRNWERCRKCAERKRVERNKARYAK
jgi:hypothetical protein